MPQPSAVEIHIEGGGSRGVLGGSGSGGSNLGDEPVNGWRGEEAGDGCSSRTIAGEQPHSRAESSTARGFALPICILRNHQAPYNFVMFRNGCTVGWRRTIHTSYQSEKIINLLTAWSLLSDRLPCVDCRLSSSYSVNCQVSIIL